MPKLNQIIAIEKGIKNSSNVEIPQAYHEIQKPALFADCCHATPKGTK